MDFKIFKKTSDILYFDSKSKCSLLLLFFLTREIFSKKHMKQKYVYVDNYRLKVKIFVNTICVSVYFLVIILS